MNFSHKEPELNSCKFVLEDDDWFFLLGYSYIELDREGELVERKLVFQTQYPPQRAVDKVREFIESQDVDETDIEILQILQREEMM